MLVTISSERVKRPYENFQGVCDPFRNQKFDKLF